MKNKALRNDLFFNLPDMSEFEEFNKVVSQYPSHKFLANPNGFLPYVYLVNYVCAYIEMNFKKPLSEIKILDWGAGKGHVHYLFKKRGATNIISCDINDVSDDSTFGQETPIIKAFNIPVVPLEHEYKLPFETSEFDVVLSFGVLEHVPNERESLGEINRVLKPGGLFFCFNLPYYLSYTQRISHMLGNYYHDRLYSKKQVRGLLNEYNFNLVDIWLRSFFPKNSVHLKSKYKLYEHLDQIITRYTVLKYFATALEFVASKREG